MLEQLIDALVRRRRNPLRRLPGLGLPIDIGGRPSPAGQQPVQPRILSRGRRRIGVRRNRPINLDDHLGGHVAVAALAQEAFKLFDWVHHSSR